VVALVEEAGLAGRGGAAFSTARKIQAVVQGVAHSRRSPLVIVNAMEGEPASVKDRVLLQLAPHLVLDGAMVLAHTLGAAEVVVCIPRTPRTLAAVAAPASPAVPVSAPSPSTATSSAPSPSVPSGGAGSDADPDFVPDTEAAARSLRAAIDERMATGTLSVPVTVARPPDRYVSGEGTALARWLGGGPALPAFSRQRLAESGVEGMPTLLDNAETVAHIGLVARFGPTWFRSLGTASDPGTALVTLSGAVARTGVAEIPLGTTLADLLRCAGGPSEPLQAVLFGGYGGEWVPLERAMSMPLVHRRSPVGAGREPGPTLGPGIVVALPARACGLAETARVVRYMAGEGAGQCGPCAFGLPALAGALEELACPTSASTAEQAHANLARWTRQIASRGACGHPDGVVRLVRSAVTTFGGDVDVHRAGGVCAHQGRPAVLPVPAPGGSGEKGEAGGR
jgi:NADH:ubiquinone oxidoreductase subunit F (NADH-binding)